MKMQTGGRAVGRNYVSADDVIWPKSKSSPLFLQLFCFLCRFPSPLLRLARCKGHARYGYMVGRYCSGGIECTCAEP